MAQDTIGGKLNGSCDFVQKIGEFQLKETTPVQLLNERVSFLMLLVFQTLSSKAVWGCLARIWGHNVLEAETVEGSNAQKIWIL